jgi:Na+/proline symporter
MPDNLEKLRQWIVVVCFSFAASVFWGMVAAGLARYFFGISEELSLLAIGLPVGLGMGIYLLPKIRRHQFR